MSEQMQLDGIYERLTPIFREVFDDDTLVATPTLVAAGVFGWDSLAHLRLILAVERTFEVDFAVSEMSSLENVAELATLIQSKLQ